MITKDGSHTLEAGNGVTYHSTFGALQESRHIFIEAGFRMAMGLRVAGATPIRVFEMGFGTGLNAFLTLLEGRPVYYEAVETAPLPQAMVSGLNYCEVLGRPDLQPIFERLHRVGWGSPAEAQPGFTLLKSGEDIRSYLLREPADLVFYDAFDPAVQPELWTAEVFGRLYVQLAPGAIFVTYCCKGAVRRALQSVGFRTEKLPGPPGKREFLRACKPIA